MLYRLLGRANPKVTARRMSMNASAKNKNSSHVNCNSCLLHHTCDNDHKGSSICGKYKTKVNSKRDTREKLVRFHCVVNNKTSSWFKPWECSDPPENLAKIAGQLQVQPKDVYTPVINDPFIEEAKRPVEAVVLSHLNMIENPKLAGKPVIVDAVVSSSSIAYLTPGEVEATYTPREGEEYSKRTIDEKSPQNTSARAVFI